MPSDIMDLDTDNADLERALAKSGAGIKREKKRANETFVYQVSPEMRIPVSKSMGKVWAARKDAGLKARSQVQECWDEAIKYYNHDQRAHRVDREHSSGNLASARRVNEVLVETENIVFANTTAALPKLFGKVPRGEFTALDDERRDDAKLVEEVTNVICTMREAPGLNLKRRARRAVHSAILTNRGILKLDYVVRDESNEQALQELNELTEKLQKAKSVKHIEELEGRIAAINDAIDFYEASGIKLSVVSPYNLVVDPDACEPDGSDAEWMMEAQYFSTEYLRAKFMTKGPNGPDSLIFQPTHVIAGKTSSELDEQTNSFSLLSEDKKHSDYGYDDDASFNSAKRTKVWFVWHKTTRRVYMFHDKDWTWPIWVWGDYLNLIRFFPYYFIWLHEGFDTPNPKGEVTYYIDQQDAVNEINDFQARARHWIKNNWLFDLNAVTSDAVEAILKGADGTARGIDLPEGKSLKDVLTTMEHPALRHPELFNKGDKYQAIDRLSSVSDVDRGAQFKTNTTNKAIEQYQAVANDRTDDKVDLIEETIGEVMWGVAQLCLQFMSSDDVADLVGDQKAKDWQRRTPQEIRRMYRFRVEAGSAQKPNSEQKRREAMQLGQILGQFVKASPVVALVILKVFKEAFTSVTMSDDEWDMVIKSIESQLQQQQQQKGEGGQGNEEQLKAAIAKMPPQAQAAVKQAIQQGVPPEEAVKGVLAKLQQSQQSQPAN